MPEKIEVPPLDEAKSNLEGAVSVIPDRYKKAVQRAKWKDKAASDAAEKNYSDGVTAAAAEKRRQKKIAKLDEEKDWRKPATEVGATRIGPGLRAKLDKWKENVRPYFETLASLELPDRTADPITNVDNRVKAVVKALVDKKKELLGT
ncbi:MAG: hypothetical protein BA066_07225 [Candidatus Korarchaeota archaeon NZ13-K]|nr:MAG: hypothetical protein BA066_07225 [Candidatus Korarchaeota archaeon NZ13-K]